MKKLKEALKKYNGRDVRIDISHQLYGDQKIKTRLDYVCSDELVGFRIQKQVIGINREKITKADIQDGITFASDIMKIDIKLQMQ